MTGTSITCVESALNRCTKSEPPVGNRLSVEASRLSEIYALMIYLKLPEIEVRSFIEKGLLQDDHLRVLEKWGE